MARMSPCIAAVWLVRCVSVLAAAEPAGRPVASVKVEPIEERLVAPQQSFVGEVVPAPQYRGECRRWPNYRAVGD